MGRRSEKLAQEMPSAGMGNRDVIQVVSRAFDIVRCFEGTSMHLGNREIADRCGLPRSTVSRLVLTLTRIGQLIYLPLEQKYALGPDAVGMDHSTRGQSCDGTASAGEQAFEESASVHMARDQFAL
jgi:hypothetical protein